MSFTNEKVTEYISSYYRSLDGELEEFRKLNEENNVPLILRETEGLLRLLLELVRPSRILEIGTAYGYSALFFAKMLPEARITTIERSPYMAENATANLCRRPEADRIDLRTGDAREILDEMIAKRSNIGSTKDTRSDDCGFDFVFIDAGKSHYQEFFERAEKLCLPGAVIVCDNILMHGWTVDRSYEGAYRHRTNVKYMRQFIDYLYSREDLTVSLISSGDGLAIIHRK